MDKEGSASSDTLLAEQYVEASYDNQLRTIRLSDEEVDEEMERLRQSPVFSSIFSDFDCKKHVRSQIL